MVVVVCYLIIFKLGIVLLVEIVVGVGEMIVMGKFDIFIIIYVIL